MANIEDLGDLERVKTRDQSVIRAAAWSSSPDGAGLGVGLLLVEKGMEGRVRRRSPPVEAIRRCNVSAVPSVW